MVVLIQPYTRISERPQSGVDMPGGHENFTAVIGDQLEQFKRQLLIGRVFQHFTDFCQIVGAHLSYKGVS